MGNWGTSGFQVTTVMRQISSLLIMPRTMTTMRMHICIHYVSVDHHIGDASPPSFASRGADRSRWAARVLVILCIVGRSTIITKRHSVRIPLRNSLQTLKGFDRIKEVVVSRGRPIKLWLSGHTAPQQWPECGNNARVTFTG